MPENIYFTPLTLDEIFIFHSLNEMNISNNSAGVSTAIQEEFQGVENCNNEKGKLDTDAN